MLAYWLHLPFFLLLLYLFWRQARIETSALVFWSGLGLKLICGIALGFIYLKFLNRGDTWLYHDQATHLADLARGNLPAYGKFVAFNQLETVHVSFQSYSNSFFFLKLLSLLYLLTGNSYWWSGAYLSLFSFWGSWFLVKQIKCYLPDFGWAATLAFLFFPSVVFWMSGVTKDSVLMGSLCFSVAYFLKLSKAQTRREAVHSILPLLLSLYLFWRIKFFLAAVLVVVLAAYLFTQWLSKRVLWLRSNPGKIGVWLGLLLVLGFVASFAHPTFTLDFFLRHILFNYKTLSLRGTPGHPHLSFPELEPTLSSVLIHSPSAVYQMLFRPFVGEPGPLFYRLAGLENVCLMLLFGALFWELIRKKRVADLPSFWAVLLVFFFISAVLVTLPTPNLGSLHRYRAPLLPFLLLPVLAWGPWQRWWQVYISRSR